MNLSVSELSKKLAKRELSAREAALDCFETIERREGELGAFITLTPESALAKADEIDRQRMAGETLPPLAGVPMALKDNICTAGVRTTCASKILENYIPLYSATVAERLERNGALLLGKLNMDEFAMGSTTETSFFHGTKNPAAPDRTPGGSSGGSAAAVAAGEAAFALGTDTGGSVRQPAAFCGAVGMKPTYGAVSRYGVVAFASSLDQVGPLTRTARDSALVLEAIAGRDPRDATSADRENFGFLADAERGVKGLKIALPVEFYDGMFARDIRRSVLGAAETFRRMGAEIIEVSAPILRNALPVYYILTTAEASSNLSRFDGVRYGHRSSSADGLDALYKKSRGEGFGAEVKRRVLLGAHFLDGENREKYYMRALRARTLIRREFARLFASCDLILTPTTRTTAPLLGETDENPETKYLCDLCTVPANLAGIPALSMPCGADAEGLPIGMQLVAPAWGERTIYRAACAYERETGVR